MSSLWIACSTVLAAIIGVAWRGRVKLDQIHVLVNSRLTEALDRIDELSDRLGIESKTTRNGD